MANIITWTQTDESPALASESFLPVVRHFTRAAGVEVRTLDISLAGRLLQSFPEYLTPAQQSATKPGDLAALVEQKDANIIKLPNASATDNQLKDAIRELQAAGYALPDYPGAPQNAAQAEIKKRYDAQTGSVVNPILRQGNAVRSIPAAVKDAARQSPHAMGTWKQTSKTRVAHMQKGDFYDTEQSLTLSPAQAGNVSIRFVDAAGKTTVLAAGIPVAAGDVLDSAAMRRADLQGFLQDAIKTAGDEGLLLSLHLKATMLKKTDGVIFGDAVQAYFKPVFDKFGAQLDGLGVSAQNGLNDILGKIEALDLVTQNAIKTEIEACLSGPAQIAMANPKDGSTHLSSPNLVIIDVSMANLARWGGEVADRKGGYGDTLAVIPNSTYARMHQVGIDILKSRGAPDPRTMGSVTTLRLQAEGAEEYGSKDTSFIAKGNGAFEVVAADGSVLLRQDVAQGDIWRMCKTTDRAVANWIDLAAEYAAKSQGPVVFWLDRNRAHDAQMIAKIRAAAPQLTVMTPEAAMDYTLNRAMDGKNTVCATGNLLGDHITDYFPILETGSSAKMLSVLKLLNGGIVAETGSGGTAPDLLDMVAKKNHFLWDDTGTALALVEALRHMNKDGSQDRIGVLADALEAATNRYIKDRRAPAPSGYDTRESHYFLTLYWAEEMARQNKSPELKTRFSALAYNLSLSKNNIKQEMDRARTRGGDVGGRFAHDPAKLAATMRPSRSLNRLIP